MLNLPSGGPPDDEISSPEKLPTSKKLENNIVHEEVLSETDRSDNKGLEK